MRLVYNSNSTMHLPALMQIRVARETGWDGVFLRAEHLRRYLGQGYSTASLREALDGLGPVNMGALADVERWRPAERAAMLEEAEALTRLAIDVGVSNVQLLSGPVAPGGRYSGPAELSPAELRRATSQAVRAVADIGAPFGIRYYLEPVAWTPLGSLARAVEVIDAAERDNAGLVLDFWHLWQRGTTPDDVARLDRRFISGVDFADSLGPAGSPVARSALALRVARRGRDPAARMGRRGPRHGLRRLVGQRAVQPAPLGMAGSVRGRRRSPRGARRPARGSAHRVAILTLRRTRCYGCAIGCRMEGAVRMQASAGCHPGDRARPARASIADTV